MARGRPARRPGVAPFRLARERATFDPAKHPHRPKGKAGGQWAPKGASTVPTRTLHTDANGDYSAERKALHQEIVAGYLAQGVRYDKPEALFLAGGTGAGKSSLASTIELPPNAITVDPDRIKTMIPEYHQMVGEGDKRAAMTVHEESSDLAQEIRTAATERRYNLVVDGTGDSEPGKFAERLREQREAGYGVKVVVVDTHVEVAIDRAEKRALRTGRMVPEPVIRQIHHDVAARHLEWRDETTDWEVWANDDSPRLVAAKANGRTVIRDRTRYDEFVEKGG